MNDEPGSAPKGQGSDPSRICYQIRYARLNHADLELISNRAADQLDPMRNFLRFLCVMQMMVGVSFAEQLSAPEAKRLVERAMAYEQAMNKVDIDKIVPMTHPGTYDKFGPEEGPKLLREMLEGIRLKVAAGEVKFGPSKISPTSEVYTSGTEQVCFLPKTTALTMGGETRERDGFLVAARGKHGKEWMFIDAQPGSRPFLLKLFPGLPKDVKMPFEK